MTDDELKALIASNARAIETNAQSTSELAHSFIDFRNELRSWVNTHNAISDDQGTDLTRLDASAIDTDARIQALRMDAIADRAANKERADADRAALIAKSDADRAEWQKNFAEQGARIDQALDELRAQRESMRALLSALAATNGRVSELEQAG